MRTINLIPKDYKGNPRNAMGYSWAKLVMDGRKADQEKSIPGEDLNINYGDCLEILNQYHGALAIRDDSGHGCIKKTAKTLDGRIVDISSAKRVAKINGMWCGGVNVSVFVDYKDIAKPEVKPKATEIHGHPDFCKLCHSFCYGDCQASA